MTGPRDQPRRNIFPIGAVLDGTYQVRELLSEGRRGQIFGAFDRQLGREVAIKAMWPHLGFAPLRDEARQLAGFQHPGLLAVHGFATHERVAFVVLERLHGMSLAKHLAQRASPSRFSLAETLEILIAICDTLGVIHAASLVHGDLRPEHVMLAPGGRVVLAEFGLVHQDEVELERSLRGLDPYRAPEPPSEQVEELQLRDIFSLGVLAFEMLAGSTPGMDTPVSVQLARITPALPDALTRLVHELLLPEPTLRPRNPGLIGASLRSVRAPTSSADALSIVVADDDPDVRDLVAAMIRRLAPTASIRLARDGAEALRMVQHAPPDLLLLDLQMPYLTGMEVCMYLRGTSLGDRITICVMSRFGESHRTVLKNLGVVDIVMKGQGTPEDLERALGKLLQRFSPDVVIPPESGMASSAVVGARYVLERKLGEGGMGRVYEARHVNLGKKFALKVISSSFAADTAAREQFNQEAKLASEIVHPNIVSVVDYGEDPQLGAYMVMELQSGETLADACRTPMSIRRACDVLGQVADALAHIHRHGIVHGDVKAGNIMLVDESAGTRRRKIARLLDFGLAHRMTTTGAHGDHIAGTPEYLAPERITGAPATAATDVYALGVLGYLLLSGTLPFDGTTQEVLEAHLALEPRSLSAQRGEPIDAALETLVERAMAKDVTQRHATAAAFHYELNTVMDMLDMRKRRARTAPSEPLAETGLVKAFTRSRIAQAVFSVDGDIAFANAAFRSLLERCGGHATTSMACVAPLVPDLAATIERVHVAGAPAECRGPLAHGGELVVWIAPLALPGMELQAILRLVDAIGVGTTAT